jgi:hypothetical protein
MVEVKYPPDDQMKRLAKWIVSAALVALSCGTWVLAAAKERKQRQLSLGIAQSQVEVVLGSPKYPGQVITNEAHGVVTQLTYRGNPSLWYGRLEHYIRVSYRDGRVVEIERYGL